MAMKSLALAILIGSPANAQPAKPIGYNDLDSTLLKIRREPGSDPWSLEQKEKETLPLLDSHGTTSAQAKIYSSIALIYASGDRKNIEIARKSADYCEKAIKYPVDAATAAQIYTMWSDDIKVLENGDGQLKGEALASHRKKVTTLLLKGLRVILKDLTQNKITAAPWPILYEGPSSPGIEKARQAQWEERSRIEFQNQLLQNRDVILRKIIGEYQSPATDVADLKKLSLLVLTDAHSEAVQQIMDGVATARREKEQPATNLTSAPTRYKFGGKKKATKVKNASSP